MVLTAGPSLGCPGQNFVLPCCAPAYFQDLLIALQNGTCNAYLADESSKDAFAACVQQLAANLAHSICSRQPLQDALHDPSVPRRSNRGVWESVRPLSAPHLAWLQPLCEQATRSHLQGSYVDYLAHYAPETLLPVGPPPAGPAWILYPSVQHLYAAVHHLRLILSSLVSEAARSGRKHPWHPPYWMRHAVHMLCEDLARAATELLWQQQAGAQGPAEGSPSLNAAVIDAVADLFGSVIHKLAGKNEGKQGGDDVHMTCESNRAHLMLCQWLFREVEARAHAEHTPGSTAPLLWSYLLHPASYTSAISTCVACCDLLHCALQHLHNMQPQCNPWYSVVRSSTPVLDRWTYIAVISSALKVNDSDCALLIFAELLRSPQASALYSPSETSFVTFKTALDLFSRRQQWELACHCLLVCLFLTEQDTQDRLAGSPSPGRDPQSQEGLAAGPPTGPIMPATSSTGSLSPAGSANIFGPLHAARSWDLSSGTPGVAFQASLQRQGGPGTSPASSGPSPGLRVRHVHQPWQRRPSLRLPVHVGFEDAGEQPTQLPTLPTGNTPVAAAGRTGARRTDGQTPRGVDTSQGLLRKGGDVALQQQWNGRTTAMALLSLSKLPWATRQAGAPPRPLQGPTHVPCEEQRQRLALMAAEVVLEVAGLRIWQGLTEGLQLGKYDAQEQGASRGPRRGPRAQLLPVLPQAARTKDSKFDMWPVLLNFMRLAVSTDKSILSRSKICNDTLAFLAPGWEPSSQGSNMHEAMVACNLTEHQLNPPFRDQVRKYLLESRRLQNHPSAGRGPRGLSEGPGSRGGGCSAWDGHECYYQQLMGSCKLSSKHIPGVPGGQPHTSKAHVYLSYQQRTQPILLQRTAAGTPGPAAAPAGPVQVPGASPVQLGLPMGSQYCSYPQGMQSNRKLQPQMPEQVADREGLLHLAGVATAVQESLQMACRGASEGAPRGPEGVHGAQSLRARDMLTGALQSLLLRSSATPTAQLQATSSAQSGASSITEAAQRHVAQLQGGQVEGMGPTQFLQFGGCTPSVTNPFSAMTGQPSTPPFGLHDSPFRAGDQPNQQLLQHMSSSLSTQVPEQLLQQQLVAHLPQQLSDRLQGSNNHSITHHSSMEVSSGRGRGRLGTFDEALDLLAVPTDSSTLSMELSSAGNVPLSEMQQLLRAYSSGGSSSLQANMLNTLGASMGIGPSADIMHRAFTAPIAPAQAATQGPGGPTATYSLAGLSPAQLEARSACANALQHIQHVRAFGDAQTVRGVQQHGHTPLPRQQQR